MAHLWHLEFDQWQPVPLAGPAVALSRAGAPVPVGSPDAAPVLLRASADKWVLLAGLAARVLLNGEPLALGCRVLRDHDEIILLGGARTYFSTERLACVEPFPDPKGAAVFCARCRQPIAPGSPAVRCPGCGAWCHENGKEKLLCWSYSEACPLCPQPSALDAGYRWEPAF